MDDAILAREAYLIYQNAFGFEPDAGNLLKWKGIVRDSVGNHIELRIDLPENFPLAPPKISLPEGINHELTGNTNNILTRTSSYWKSNNHIYQVIKEAQQLISNGKIIQGNSNLTVTNLEEPLKRQIDYLKHEIEQKKTEIESLKSQSSSSISMDKNQKLEQIKEESILSIDNELYSLEESYDRLEIDGTEFAKEFIKLQKRYYMLQES